MLFVFFPEQFLTCSLWRIIQLLCSNIAKKWNKTNEGTFTWHTNLIKNKVGVFTVIPRSVKSTFTYFCFSSNVKPGGESVTRNTLG